MKRILKILAIIVAVLIVIAIAIPFFIDANTFRPKLETELTDALGRQVKVGNLSLSLFSGSVSADDISIADDPAFSKSAFVQAKSLKVGVEMMPLIFSKTLNVTELTLNQPEISLVRSENGEKWNFSSLGGNNKSATKPAASSGNPNLSVAKLNVNNGRLTVSRAGSEEKPHVYDKVNIEVTNFSFTSSFPFKMTAQLPADGSLKLEGKTGPINADNAAETPLEAKVTIQKMNLLASGLIDPAAGISGIADYEGTVTSDGHEAKTQGKLTATNLQVVKKGSPAGKPVQVTYTVRHDLAKQTGTIPQCEIAMGKAVAHMTGTYDAHGKVTSVNLKVNAQGMPVDDLEAILPAVGVILPPKATLKGGTLATTMAIAGPVDKLVTVGNVQAGKLHAGELQPGIETLRHLRAVGKEHGQRHHDSEFQLRRARGSRGHEGRQYQSQRAADRRGHRRRHGESGQRTRFQNERRRWRIGDPVRRHRNDLRSQVCAGRERYRHRTAERAQPGQCETAESRRQRDGTVQEEAAVRIPLGGTANHIESHALLAWLSFCTLKQS